MSAGGGVVPSVGGGGGGGVLLARLPCSLRLMVFALSITCTDTPDTANAFTIFVPNGLRLVKATILASVALSNAISLVFQSAMAACAAVNWVCILATFKAFLDGA